VPPPEPPSELSKQWSEAKMSVMAIANMLMTYYEIADVVFLPAQMLMGLGEARAAARITSLEERRMLEVASKEVALNVEKRTVRQAIETTGSAYVKGEAGKTAVGRLTAHELRPGVTTEVRYSTTLGDRFVDVDPPGTLLHETKNKYSYLDKVNRLQIAKDIEISLATGKQPFWHLFKGGSQQLKMHLQSRGIMFRDYRDESFLFNKFY
jgi:hypothetical protein